MLIPRTKIDSHFLTKEHLCRNRKFFEAQQSVPTATISLN